MKRSGWASAGALAVAVAAALATMSVIRPRCTELYGDQTLTIPLDRLARGTADFFCFRDRSGKKLRFLLERDADGTVVSAFDACRQCYRFGKGYSIANGELICRVCGNHYKLSKILTGKASCVPVKLNVSQGARSVQVKVSDLEAGRSLF
jgi:uncharacterized membrane protein